MIVLDKIKTLKDNYVWLLTDTEGSATVIDPGEALPVIQWLTARRCNLKSIFVTHHHIDHVQGIDDLRANFPDVLVYGSVLSPLNALTDHCKEGMVVQTGLLHSHSFSVIDLPGHTLDHIGFYDSRHLFCGDTLFACGCGRIFEGSPETLHASLTKICSLDDTLAVCCAHEYTLSNLEFALHVDPENSELKNYADQLARKFEHTGTTLPVLLKDEKQFNPFLRCQDSAILNSVLRETPNFTPKNEIEVFAALREWKNRF